MASHYVPKPGSREYQDQMARYNEDQRPQQYVAIAICTVAPTLAVILRLYAQRVRRKQWGLDDLLIIVALVRRVIGGDLEKTPNTIIDYTIRADDPIHSFSERRSGPSPSPRST